MFVRLRKSWLQTDLSYTIADRHDISRGTGSPLFFDKVDRLLAPCEACEVSARKSANDSTITPRR